MNHITREQLHSRISNHILRAVSSGGKEILEAGCGRYWPFQFDGAEFTLTGVDMDEIALQVRKEKDLDVAVFGDLRTVSLPVENFDIIYNAFVLEHVEGARSVLENFVRWLKPGGILVLTFPNRDSVYGFFTRITPLWVHIAYKRYIKGNKSAGKPGCAPYPTYYDKILSRQEFLDFVSEQGLAIKEEASFGKEPTIIRAFMRVIEMFSFGRLSATDQSLMYVIEKPNGTNRTDDGTAA